MFREHRIFAFAIIANALFVCCNSYTPKQSSSNLNGTTGNGQPGYAVPSYSYVQTQVFQPYCISCHSSAGGNPAGVNLETYSSTIQNLSNINTVTLISQIMPPSHPLPLSAQSTLKSWIDGGAPLNGIILPGGSPTPSPTPGTTPTPTPSVLQPTYSSLALNIFTPKCIACHSAGGSEASRPLDTYQGVMAWVKAANLSGSILYNDISSGKMPPGNPLSQAQVQSVSTWISDGAQNN